MNLYYNIRHLKSNPIYYTPWQNRNKSRAFSGLNMDYSKYIHCPDCIESGLYCPRHQIEIERILRQREIKKLLKLKDHKSDQYRHAIMGLLESYQI